MTVDLMPRLERELAAPVVRHFAARGCRVDVEVEFNGRIADVIAVSPDGEVDAVELKLRDWAVAERQARAYQVGAHRAWVALPLASALRYSRLVAFRRAFEKGGCGLLAVNHPFGDVREVIPARASARRLDFLADHLADRSPEGPGSRALDPPGSERRSQTT